MNHSKRLFSLKTLFLTVIMLVAGSGLVHAGTLFVATDNEDFSDGSFSCVSPAGVPGVDRLAVVTTNGPLVTNVEIICTTFLINGLADADGKLLAGTPEANPLNTVGFDGSLISSIVAPGIPNNNCCNEEMLFVPQPGGGEKFYHAHYSDLIREINPVTGAQVGSDFPQNQVVGMALINGEIWITKWAPRQVGIWDPADNSFTHQAQFDGAVPGRNYGALAWDPVEEILWLGSTGGFITPFNLAGVQQGPAEQPLGAFNDTIDGMTFLGEVTDVTLEAEIDIKFCSDPNALNCKKRGNNPVTIFGTDDLDVTEIDISSLRLCLADDTDDCTPSGPQAWSMADRGDPTTDIGADSCAIDPATGEQLDTLNPDGKMDLDVAFDAQEVVALVGCGGLAVGDVTETLVIKGTLDNGTEFTSIPQDDDAVDQYLVQRK